MIDISKAFGTPAEPIGDFFQRPGVGYYIPLYQREYSWTRENIDQLMEDMICGVDSLMTNDDAIHFMGTVILVKETNPTDNIRPIDRRALPSTINNVIDGQQRISSVSLLACLLYQLICNVKNKLPNGANEYDELREEAENKLTTLKEMFSVDIRRGNPKRKPIIVRGSVDGWTFDGDDKRNYRSDVSSFLAEFTRAVEGGDSDFPPTPKGSTLVGKNISRMNFYLNKIQKAHQLEDSIITFPPAWKILESIDEKHIWSYPREGLTEIVINRDKYPAQQVSHVCSLVQLFSFVHFLLYRSCFTLIEPTNEDWAFDMFQSLNGTGTPLTAIETFKPLVVNLANNELGGYKSSTLENYFKNVDDLLGKVTTASQKSKLTNEYLVALALTEDGTKLPNQFSTQRKWLTNRYTTKFVTSLERESFMQRMSNLAQYWQNVIDYDPNEVSYVRKINSALEEDKKIASVCVLFLKDAGHKMAHTILSRFYAHVLRAEDGAVDNFISACKAVAAFFAIWRSVLPNTGLDEVYRLLLRGDIDHNVPRLCWDQEPSALTVENLKHYLKNTLISKGIEVKEDWLGRASQQLKFNRAKAVCKFALFVSAHDTIIDPENAGLMKIGTSDSYCYLDPEKWVSKDFKNIEHIAPQNRPEGSEWDELLYVEDHFHNIGNLTLLPTEINSSAGNKNWSHKLIYFRHLAETDPDSLAELEREALSKGVELSPDTIELLKDTKHKHHIRPIVLVGPDAHWDKALVDKRSARICDILWTRLIKWLD